MLILKIVLMLSVWTFNLGVKAGKGKCWECRTLYSTAVLEMLITPTSADHVKKFNLIIQELLLVPWTDDRSNIRKQEDTNKMTVI